MANFAILNHNDQVISIEYIENSVLIDNNGIEKEINGINYILSLRPDLKANQIIQVSANGNFRGGLPDIGSYYIRSEDGFAERKNPPYPSWKLNKFYHKWESPQKLRENIVNPIWDENKKEWKDIDKNSRISL